MAVSVAPLTTTVMNSVAQNRVGVASGVNNTVARAAGLIAIAILGIVMLRVFDNGVDRRVAAWGLPDAASRTLQAQRTKLAAIVFPDDQDLGTRKLMRQAVGESFVGGFRTVMGIGAILALASAMAAFVFVRAQNATVTPPN